MYRLSFALCFVSLLAHAADCLPNKESGTATSKCAAGKLLSSKGILTYYSAPNEADFGKPESSGVEPVTYKGPDGKDHTSLFVRNFTGRDSSDPKNSDISGVAMEGSGYIEPSFHKDDPYLSGQIDKGYGVLNLIDWNESTQSATFMLAQAPMGDSGKLIMNVSAAVKVGNKLIHPDDCLGIFLQDGSFLGYRLVNDSCSSCPQDEHVDLFMPVSFSGNLNGPARIYLMPRDFCPKVEERR